MRRFFRIGTVTILLSCSRQSGDNQIDSSNTVLADKDTATTIKPDKDNGNNYLTSTYDDPNSDLDRHVTSLKELSDSSVFNIIHDRLILTLDKRHQDYFNSNSKYQLVYISSGDLFQNGKEDNGFVVFDKNHTRVSILVYDALQDRYSELFRDIKVKNGLTNADCTYGTYGTHDYQLADELIYQRDYLIKDPLKQIEYTNCKIADISKDKDFVLEGGCFAKDFSADGKNKSLCIPTSSVYNNWECLTYDKSKNEFVFFYGRAFAD
jgi:hypothetical protein